MDEITWAHMMTAGSPSELDLRAAGLSWLRSRAALLWLGILISICAIASLSLWDVKRRHAESMEDFGQLQERLAKSLALQLQDHLQAGVSPSGPAWSRVLKSLVSLEQAGVTMILLWSPHSAGFVSLSGRPAPPGFLAEALARGQSFTRIDREVAAALGLPRRAAMVGLASFHDAAGATYRVAAVATALRARDREIQAARRALLSVLVAAGAVLLLGALALHWQRQELRTQKQLALEEAHRRREADLERASRAATLGTLAMGITHELSTPLSIIAARAEQLISRLPADERSGRGAQVIAEQAERMGQIIRGILALVRDQPPIADRLSPLAVGKGAVALVQHRFAEVGVELRVSSDAGASLSSLRGDQRLLEQAVVNLLLNACDACRGGGQVGLQMVSTDGQVVFRVLDDGVGISPEAAARAMEPFFTTKPVGQGSGLGLAVTHEIVKSHRGTLRIEPRKGGGTCAEIALPQAEEGHAHAT